MSASAASLPLVKIAAGAVIILSAVGVGVMTGLIPGVSSKDQPASVEQAAKVETPAAQAAHSAGAMPKSHTKIASAQPAKAATPVCANCGVIESINAVEVKGQATGAGAVAGAVGGLIVGNQIGRGKGRTLAKVAGAVGGAYAGNEIEKNVRKTTEYHVAVRMNDGTTQTVAQPNSEGLSPGMRVKIVDSTVIPD